MGGHTGAGQVAPAAAPGRPHGDDTAKSACPLPFPVNGEGRDSFYPSFPMDRSELVPPMRKSPSLTSTTLITSAFCTLLGAFVFIATSGYPSVHSQGFGRGPAFYPRVLAGLMIFIGVLTLIQDIRHARRDPPAEPAAGNDAPPVSYRPVAVFLLLCAVREPILRISDTRSL